VPVKVSLYEKDDWFDLIEKEDSCFILSNKSGREIKINTPLKLDSNFRDKDFEVYFLAKKNVKENEIYQVYRKRTDSRIGWIIPVLSFDSALHDFADNEHFLRYAYVGIRESLKSLTSKVHSKTLMNDTLECKLSEIFHEETVLLILSKETYKDDFVFEIDRAIPSLIKHGYISLKERDPGEIKHQAAPPEGPKLYIEEIVSSLDNCSLIAELMSSLYAYEEKPIFRFFYLYQIFELLIDGIYKNEQEVLIQELIDSKGDSGRTKDALDKMQQFMSEKKRLGLLINEYTGVQSELTNLKSICNDLLMDLGRDKSDNFESYFYKIRNFIFHQYRDFPDHSIQMLDSVVDEVVSLMPVILGRYKVPHNVR